jgi:membrane-associated protease RseP (regulator of RpoE activity)
VELIGPRRRPLSRETRLLLVMILVSLGALWVLARLRFADRPVSPNPIAPVLTQLGPPPVFEQLSSALFQVQTDLVPFVIGIETRRPISSGHQGAYTVAALRFGAEIAIAMLGDAPIADDDTDLRPAAEVVARDPATGLAVLHVMTRSVYRDPGSAPAMWSPRRPGSPRYLVAAEVTGDAVSGRPVFVGPLQAIASPVWGEMIWALPADTDLSPGTFVFTAEGAFAGLVADTGGGLTLVPGDAVKNLVERLRREGHREYGQLGIEVQPLTADVASGTGAEVGVVVTWIDPQGPAAGHLAATDVIEALDDGPLFTYEHWRARATRLTVGQTVSVRVTRGNGVQTVMLTAGPRSTTRPPRQLGLTMRTVQRTGVEVLEVAPASAAAVADIQPGDVITLIGDREAPTPAQVRRLFAAAAPDRPVLVAVTRGTGHHVLTLEK